ncbi:unnamed protein product [Acidocella sp. C78]|uniref:hypothetical protein n=1 Tax=Acidocella sp. C78 TaxID=1671486 RepID=UPI001BC529DB|nr:hypothetical protein [Acidocella sp. C78]CAG4914667.1 unnamed protein product [Acidocella sp. C78]
MRQGRYRAAVALAAALAAALLPPLAGGAARAAGVTVGKATLASGLIGTMTPKLRTEAPQLHAEGRVLDPAPAIALHGRIVAAQVAATLDAATLARTRSLYHAAGNVSRASLEQAEAAARGSAARLATLRAEAIARFGVKLGRAIAQDGPAFRAIAAGGALVLAVRAGPALKPAPARATARLPDGTAAALRAIGPAGVLPPGLVGQALLFTGPSLPVGTPLDVSLPAGRKIAGYDVPAAALVWHRGRAFVFVRTAPGRFAAIAVGGASSAAAGGAATRFVPAQALPPAPAIVVRGAGLLNSMLAGGGDAADQD